MKRHSTSIGLDVHARSAHACALVHGTGEVRSRRFSDPTPADIASWASAFPGPAMAAYETGPTGYGLARGLSALGIECVVAASCKIERASGDKVKTDARDAAMLARMLAAGTLSPVRIPTPEEESLRDLVRGREDARLDLSAAKLRVSHLLLRHGLRWDRSTWTKAHVEWMRSVRLEGCAQTALNEALSACMEAQGRRDRLQAAVEEQAAHGPFAALVARLKLLDGVSDYTALAVAVEVGDFGRFPRPGALASWLGLVPSESSSGERRSRGPITRCGNALVRRLLVEACWQAASRRPRGPVPPGASGEAAAIAERANARLRDRAARLRARGKEPCKVNVALAREMACFMWELARAE